ncbi:toxin [Clostridia bacterium]|nr:toxin [Clostridia bacterium]
MFEFDKAKSASNKEKHGIDFYEAQMLWRDSTRIEFPSRNVGETRTLVVGRIGEKVYTAVVTPRNGNIRIISVRRARKEEVILYETNKR